MQHKNEFALLRNEYYRPYKDYLTELFPEYKKVWKVSIDAGFTCPNRDGSKSRGGCTYCNNESFSPAHGNDHIPVHDQVSNGVKFLKHRYKADKYIAYFQPYTNTYAPIEKLRALYEEAIAHPDVCALTIGTRPDCVTPEVVALCEELSQKVHVTLELGLQTSHDSTLERINRCDTWSEFERAMNLLKGSLVETCIHIIIGLPGEDRSHFVETAQKIGQWKYHTLKLHPLHIVKQTIIVKEFKEGAIELLTEQEYIESVTDFLEWVPADVGIQRFTGETGDDSLIAPDWCKKKNTVQIGVIAEFQKRGTRQGSSVLN
ncbi:MAG: TIGR01212 family radical SAM protein [Fibrobacterales bacterium]